MLELDDLFHDDFPSFSVLKMLFELDFWKLKIKVGVNSGKAVVPSELVLFVDCYRFTRLQIIFKLKRFLSFFLSLCWILGLFDIQTLEIATSDSIE